jgi:putative ABC transport system substrate-binding protein
MGRRQFIAGLAGAAVLPPAARAQQTSAPVIGLLCGGTSQSDASRLNAFRQGLNEAGYIEGRNVTLEYRWAEQHYDRMPALAADLVRREVALIVTVGGIPSAVAAKPTTSTIPILIAIGGDPVQLGLVASEGRCHLIARYCWQVEGEKVIVVHDGW